MGAPCRALAHSGAPILPILGENWQPMISLRDVLGSIRQMLEDPYHIPEDRTLGRARPILQEPEWRQYGNLEAVQLLEDQAAFEYRAREDIVEQILTVRCLKEEPDGLSTNCTTLGGEDMVTVHVQKHITLDNL